MRNNNNYKNTNMKLTHSIIIAALVGSISFDDVKAM
jgi:hypothetical protein